jgi:hypothetical protein
MDSVKIELLRYFLENGKIDLNSLHSHFHYDMSDQEFNNSINYLIGKKYLIPTNEHSVEYHISEIGRTLILNILKDKENASDRRNAIEQLQVENLKLQNDNLKYQNSLRTQQSEIDRLTIENLKLQNKQLRRYIFYSIIGFVAGAFLSKIKEIIDFFVGLIQRIS